MGTTSTACPRSGGRPTYPCADQALSAHYTTLPRPTSLAAACSAYSRYATRRPGEQFETDNFPVRHLLNMDPPEHRHYRRLLSAHFTPRALDSEACRRRAADRRDPRRDRPAARGRLRPRRRRGDAAGGDRRDARPAGRGSPAVLSLDERDLGRDRQRVPAGNERARDDEIGRSWRRRNTSRRMVERAPPPADRRLHQPAGQRAARRQVDSRLRAAVVSHPAGRGGQRDHPQRRQRRAARPDREPRRAGRAAPQPGPRPARRRGDRALGDAR